MMRNDDRSEDLPPYSRVFIVCSKQLNVEDLRPAFEQYGEIEDMYMPRDRQTGDSKGIAYVKYTKTSSAAQAIEELHQKNLPNYNKPVKVMVASHKGDQSTVNDDKYKRLFIRVHRTATEDELKEHFGNYGRVESIRIQRDKVTDECRGFAYINYKTFYEAAKAFEECDRKFKPIFATPKELLKRNRNSLESFDNYPPQGPNLNRDPYNYPRDDMNRDNAAMIRNKPQEPMNIFATCNPVVPQRYIERLFNIIPGMVQFKYTSDTFNSCSICITYDNEESGRQAVERINNFEFPSGEVIHVQPNALSKAANDLSTIVNSFKNALDTSHPNLSQLADAIAQASTLIKAATSGQEVGGKPDSFNTFCSVPLPPPQPLAGSNTRVAQRCFLVFKPQPLPIGTLRDAFCRFGDLIDVSTFPNKTFGFAKYASVGSAQEAIRVLHGATVCGVKLKVMKADEKSKDKGEEYPEMEGSDHDTERKRMKMSDDPDM